MVEKKTLILFAFSVVFLFGVLGIVSAAITSITVTSPNGGEVWGGTQPITWTATGSDGDRVNIYYDSGSGGTVLVAPFQLFSAGSFSWDTSEASDGGNYKIIVASTDFGVIDISNNKFIIDNTVPTITDDYAESGTWVTATQTVTLTPSDSNGIDEVLICEGSGCTPSTPLSGPTYQLSFSTSQDTIVRYRATDNAGNPSAIGEFNVKLDVDNPTVGVDGAPSDLIVDKGGVTATISCTDSTSGCNETKYKVYTINPGASCSPADLGTYTDGTSVLVTDHSWVCAYAKDNAGNDDFSTPVEFSIFDTIQGAIGAASPGKTINVAGGTYAEALAISKNDITLAGAGESSVIINVAGKTLTLDSGIAVTGTGVTLKDFTVTSDGSNHPRYGIKFSNTNHGTIQYVTVHGVYRSGIDMASVSDMTINHVTSQDNGGNGLGLRDISDSTISNIVTSGNVWGGVRIQTYFGTINGVVVSGTNDFQETGTENGGLYLEQGNSDVAGPPYKITYGISGTPDVLLQTDDFNYALSGNDDEAPQYQRIWLYKTLSDAQDAAALPSGTPSHITDERYIESLIDNNLYIPSNLGSIQAAIDAASDGDTINVAAGTYNEALTIDKGLTLLGDPGNSSAGPGENAPVLDGSSFSAVPAIKIGGGVSGVTIEGFEIKNYGPTSNTEADAIQAWNSGTSNIIIRDNYMHDLGWDAVLVGNEGQGLHTGWIIQNNKVENSVAYGIELTNTENSEIVGNEITTTGFAGILLQARNTISESGLIIVSGNEISDNHVNGGVSSIYLIGLASEPVEPFNPITGAQAELTNTIVSGNIITGGGETVRGIRILGFETGSINTLVVTNNDVTSADIGVLVDGDVTAATINNNKIAGNDIGLDALNGIKPAIENVDATNNWWGHITGPSDVGPGEGDAVSNNVDFDPWWVTETGGNDVTPPESEITLSGTIYKNTGTFDLPYTASDDWGLKRVRLYEDGEGPVKNPSVPGYAESYSSTFSIGGLLDGTYKYYTVAVDIRDSEYGGVEAAPESADVTIVVDTNPPITTDSGTDIAWHDSDVTVILTPSDDLSGVANTYYCVDQEDSCTPTTSGTSVTVSTEGTNYVRYYSVDNAGNTESVETAANAVKIDKSNPTIDYTQLVTKRVVGDSTEVSATITDASNIDSATLHYTVDGSPGSETMNAIGDDYTATIPTSTEKGTVTYYITATDNAGNSKTSDTYTVTVNDLIWDLSNDWNLVSVPKTLATNLRSTLLPSNAVWTYDGTSWVTPSTINPGIGYWVDNISLTSLGLDYAAITGGNSWIPPVVTLQPGWNLIGHMCTSDENITNVPSLRVDSTHQLFVLNYNASEDKFGVCSLQSSGWSCDSVFGETKLKTGEGYWVFSDAEIPYTNVC